MDTFWKKHVLYPYFIILYANEILFSDIDVNMKKIFVIQINNFDLDLDNIYNVLLAELKWRKINHIVSLNFSVSMPVN